MPPLIDLDRERNRRRPWDATQAAAFIEEVRERVDITLAGGRDPSPIDAAVVIAVEKLGSGVTVMDLPESERDALALVVQAGRSR